MHILITDDFLTSRFQIGLVLKNMGFSFDEASNGDEAIELITKRDYDLVLMDIEMPVRNGMETVLYIREKMEIMKGDLLVVAVTSHDSSINSDDFIKIGFNALISKPVTEKKISSLLLKHKK
jgi:CheY-like chemotaxis protein